MSFSYSRRYRGPVQMVILDWAGTTMDYGCVARPRYSLRSSARAYNSRWKRPASRWAPTSWSIFGKSRKTRR